MRNKSKTNSRRFEDLTFRYAYRDENPTDEIAHLFPVSCGDAALPFGSKVYRISRFAEAASEVHHISSCVTGTLRWDVLTNLIHLSNLSHQWVERNAWDGLVLCVAAKRAKGEWDDAEFSRISHVPNVLDYLSTKTLNHAFARQLFRKMQAA